MNNSLLAKANEKDLKTSPYPYLIIRDALEESYYKKLEAAYPNDKTIAGKNMKNNTRYQISATKSWKMSQIWQDFVAYHTSQVFYDEFISLFGKYLPEKLSWVKSSNVYIRNSSKQKSPRDVMADCQVGINSPVTEISSVKGPHVDNQVELFAGLFYMRADEDDSTGGGLEIYKPKDSNMKLIHKKVYNESLFDKVDEIPYSKNTFIIFLCSKHSIHGVQPRSVTPHSRRLVNVIAELQGGSTW